MQVTETTLQALLGGQKQFQVPMFQRTYTWGDADHRQLWRDIVAQYEVHRDGRAGLPGSSNHFIGSFVLAPSDTIGAAMPTFLVVDGQQRLTTLTIVLCALRDAMARTDPVAFRRVTDQYLTNPFATRPEHRAKFVPTEDDRPAYTACVDGAQPGSGSGLVAKAYRFYEAQLSLPGPDDEPLDHALLEQIIVSRLAIVDITAQVGDNVHRIFESLNATGVGLTQADLLRNYMFMLLPTRNRSVYERVWRPMQEELGAEHLEGLARVDLRRRGIDVRDDDVYRSQQTRLRPFEGDEAAIEREIEDLAVRAGHYRRILDPNLEDDPAVRRGLVFIKRWRATTTHPLLMHLFERRASGAVTSAQFGQVLLNVESFLVRRLLVGVSNKNLNRIFIQLVAQLRQDDADIVDAVRLNLSTQRKFWATDAEVREAARSKPFYFYGRAEQRRMVLERLEEAHAHRERAELSSLALSIEHVMPQTLSPEWFTELAAEGEDVAQLHRELVHTLGNLTLTAYNGELSNSPYERKRQILDDSNLSMNKSLVDEAHWGRAQIERRADVLAEVAIATWPAPVEGVADAPVGFDWTRVRAAIAAIPAGHWTAHADLAALAGTHAVAVGSHIGTNPSIAKAHRVLTHEGKVSAGFVWPDEGDTRDPRAVLTAEGVAFDDSGRADPAQRLDLAALQALAEVLVTDDEPLDDDAGAPA